MLFKAIIALLLTLPFSGIMCAPVAETELIFNSSEMYEVQVGHVCDGYKADSEEGVLCHRFDSCVMSFLQGLMQHRDQQIPETDQIAQHKKLFRCSKKAFKYTNNKRKNKRIISQYKG